MDLIIEHKRAWARQSRYDWTRFSKRVGIGPGGFADRLSRARLLYLRRREVTSNWLALALVLALLPGLFAPAPARAGTFGEVQAGSLFWRAQDGGTPRAALRVDTRVDARVSGMIARVVVRQEFRNDSQEWMDGTYVFPLAEKAAVDRLEMHIGERMIVGEIREREAARKVYEQARASGQRASLVEQERPNLFTTSVANVPPGASIVVEIGYLESLDYSGEEWRMRIPLTLTPRYVPGGTEAPPPQSPMDPGGSVSQRASIRISIDAGMPLANVKSLHHRVATADTGRTLAFGPGQMEGSSPPGGSGVTVIAGHRDTHFAFLRSVAVGDALELALPDGRQLSFVVSGTRIIDSRRSGIDLDAPGAALMLVTCYPFDAVRAGGPLRYEVKAEQVTL